MPNFPYQGSDAVETFGLVPLMGNNLKSLRERRKWRHEDAASKMGMSKGGYIKIERGENQLTSHTINKAAEVFGVTPGEILANNVVSVVGTVHAGGVITVASQDLSEEIYSVELPMSLADDGVAFEIADDGMWPRFELGAIIVVPKDGRAPSGCLDEEGVTLTPDGARYLKHLRRGSGPGSFDLEGHNSKTIRDVVVTSFYPLITTVPSFRVTRILSGADRRKLAGAGKKGGRQNSGKINA